jgi:hypothetical protein
MQIAHLRRRSKLRSVALATKHGCSQVPVAAASAPRRSTPRSQRRGSMASKRRIRARLQSRAKGANVTVRDAIMAALRRRKGHCGV